jgi:indolepyruvate ferredoxin oxidoreductase
MMTGFAMLARLKGLRGTAFDIFGYSRERRMERRLLAEYESDLDLVRQRLAPGRVEAAAALLSVPSMIRGFGHVKDANSQKAQGERARLLVRLGEDKEEAAVSGGMRRGPRSPE